MSSQCVVFPPPAGEAKGDVTLDQQPFRCQRKSPKLTKQNAELFHTMVAKGLFLCKRGRPDIDPAIAFLTTRVCDPTQEDWDKLVQMLRFLRQTCKDRLTLRADGKIAKWYVDAAFGVHPDFKSQTGATMTMGKGAIFSISRKQKLNTRSSTEAELVAADDVVGSIV
jgi:hypothetical protein